MGLSRIIDKILIKARALVAPVRNNTIENDGTDLHYTNNAGVRIALSLGPAGTYQILSEKGAANGYAALDAGAKIPLSQVPAIALSEIFVVADIAARDALVVQEGDVAKVADDGTGNPKDYIYDGTSWLELIAGPVVLNSTNTFTRGQVIDGSVDEEQFVVEAAPGQSSDVFVVRDSAGSPSLVVLASKDLVVHGTKISLGGTTSADVQWILELGGLSAYKGDTSARVAVRALRFVAPNNAVFADADGVAAGEAFGYRITDGPDAGGFAEAALLKTDEAAGVTGASGYMIARSNKSPTTLASDQADGYAQSLTHKPNYFGDGTIRTITRHNYLDLRNPVLDAGATTTVLLDACVVRFDAAAGTHKALAAGVGAEASLVKLNVNGAIEKIPSYSGNVHVHALAYVSTAVAQTIATGAGYTNILNDGAGPAATTAGPLRGFTHVDPGRLKYTDSSPRMIKIEAPMSILPADALAIRWTLAIFVFDDSASSGAIVTGSEMTIDTSAQDAHPFASLLWHIQLDTDDYFEIHAKHDNGSNRDVTVVTGIISATSID